PSISSLAIRRPARRMAEASTTGTPWIRGTFPDRARCGGHAMKTRNFLTGAFLLVAVLTQGAIALSRSGESSVTVLAHGPAGLRTEGKSSDVSLEEDASVLTFKVPLAPIETGIGL